MQNKESLKEKLIKRLCMLGYPKEFGMEIAEQLGSEKALLRMLGYLRQVDHARTEDIVDEMIAILEERAAWVSKKKAEYYNQKRNEIILAGFEEKK